MRAVLCVALVFGFGAPAGAPTAYAQTTYTVTNTNDSGAGSFRQAIVDANANAGADLIHFNIPGTGPHTIAPTSMLPAIDDPVVIDGYTQPGSSPNTSATVGLNTVLMIELSGHLLAPNAIGLFIRAGSSTVRGLAINRFDNDDDNGGYAIWLDTGDGNTIEGNFIGTDPTGTEDRGNGNDGIFVYNGSATNTIGGTTPAARNLISGNDRHGILLFGGNVTDNTIAGNLIGTDVTGTAALGNTLDAIQIASGSSNNTVGGTAPGSGNVLSASGDNGIHIWGGSENVVSGNFVGTDATGLAALANGGDGILIEDAANNVVGGADSAARNVIAGNGDEGIDLDGDDSDDNVVEGNYIGVGADGSTLIGNDGEGVNTDSGNRTSILRNTIAGNDNGGIAVESGMGHVMRFNRIYDNGGLGIDLYDEGFTANDPGDADTGANRLQNFPDMASAMGDNGSLLTIMYTVPSATANSTYPLQVDFYLADAAGQEGMTFLGTDVYEAGSAEQQVSATFGAAKPVADGDMLVATATDADGNTSEFSPPIQVSGSVVANGRIPARPQGFTLGAAYPNPFGVQTVFTLETANTRLVVVEAFDILGRRVATLHDGVLPGGSHDIRFNAEGLPNGVYAIRAASGGAYRMRSVTVLR